MLSCVTDRLLVKVHGLKVAALYACDLRAEECGPVLEVLRAVLRPHLKPFVVGCEGLKMFLFLIMRSGIPARRVGERAIEVKLYFFELGR